MKIAATSAAVKEEHSRESCMYCGTKFEKEWEIKIINGLERRVNKCEGCGRELRRKKTQGLNINQIARVHSLDWGEEVRVNTNY